MDAPSLTLLNYTFRFGLLGYSTVVGFDGKDAHVRSVELESVDSTSDGFYLSVEEDDSILLNFPAIESVEGEAFRKIPLRFLIGYTETDGDDYEDIDLLYVKQEVFVYATSFVGDPTMQFLENLASRVTESTSVVIHGYNLTDGLSIHLSNGESDYVIPPEDIEFDINSDGSGTATFTVHPGMLAMDGDGTEPCAQYGVYFSYGSQVYGDTGLAIIRYKYDTENDEMRKYSTEDVTREKGCYITGTMKMVFDTVDEYGNPVTNADADPRLGETIYVKRKTTDDCTKYVYTMVRVKYNKNLDSKSGLLKLNGTQLYAGDVVWLSHQLIESENGLWVVDDGNWYGYDPFSYDPESSGGLLTCPSDCTAVEKPYPVDRTVLVDLGVKVDYPVDYVCRSDVPYKCGSRTICGYNVVPGNVVALLNQADGGNGVYLVRCDDWLKVGDVNESDVKGITVDFSHSVIVQNDIDFCSCGGVFHIDYYFLAPSCYLHHMQRTVKIVCEGASIAPNKEGAQFAISEYQIRTGEEDSLIGYRGRTPGDPVKEDCIRANEDFETDYGISLIEHRQYVIEPGCIPSPLCKPICDIPRIYTLRMPSNYTSSNDKNGFTIKFWRREDDGWHLYAYIGSGTQQSGMHYYVYHLHVRAKATENMIDVNENDWFTETTGVLANGDGADSFGLCDDTWEFLVTASDGTQYVRHNLDSETLYMPWRISCTTSLFAHYSLDDDRDGRLLRTTCKQMNNAAMMVAAIGDMCTVCEGTGELDGSPCPYCDGDGRDPDGYLVGMPHLYGVAYYDTVMSKSQFVSEYNRYDPECIWSEVVSALITDDDTEITNDDGTTATGTFIIGTDDEKGLRK